MPGATPWPRAGFVAQDVAPEAPLRRTRADSKNRHQVPQLRARRPGCPSGLKEQDSWAGHDCERQLFRDQPQRTLHPNCRSLGSPTESVSGILRQAQGGLSRPKHFRGEVGHRMAVRAVRALPLPLTGPLIGSIDGAPTVSGRAAS